MIFFPRFPHPHTNENISLFLKNAGKFEIQSDSREPDLFEATYSACDVGREVNVPSFHSVRDTFLVAMQQRAAEHRMFE